ncbi:MAG TPA: septum formation initiator family protein [Chloroflexota bacterium]|nr:septum formation initiator family protein [Chloroflexota bacterium]HZU07787.1 septum formation initiator family protein [Chloroflexota bacterium]
MRERHISGTRLPPGLLLAVLVPVCLFMLAATAQRAVEGYEMSRRIEAVRREVAALQQRNLELQARIARYRSDAYIERVAREELNLVRPGDVPVIVIAPTPQPTPVATARATPTAEVPVPRQWLRQFFDEP